MKAINEILNQSIEPQMQKLDADRRRYIAFKDKESLLGHLNEKLRIFELTMKKRLLDQRELDLGSNLETQSVRKGQLKLNAERLAELDAQIKQAAAKSSNSPLLAYNKIRSLIA